MYSNVNPNIS